MSYLSDITSRWEEILESVKEDYDLSSASFRTWLEPTVVIAVLENENKVVISVPLEKPAMNILDKKYKIFLRIKIEEFTGFRCDDIDFISSLDEGRDFSEDDAGYPSSSFISENSYKATNLNELYTFNSFVVGSNNRMAHAAALAVAETPGSRNYNPLFIYGGVGLGKTHLMHAIGNFILKNDPKKKVLYVSSEIFTNELIEYLRKQKVTEFKEKYRKIDVLLIDDIQFIIGKDSTIEEFFYTFNELYNAGKQIVISSDRSPREYKITNLEDRLVSRFEWGFPVDIQAPDYETRVAIIRKKEELDHYTIDTAVTQFIAEKIRTNIRELEGALNKVVAASKLLNSEITLEFAQDILKDFISDENREHLTPTVLINTVADHFSLTKDDILSSKRNKELVLPRQIVMYLCREEMNMKQETIAKALDRDRTTVIYGVRKIAEEMKSDESLRMTIEVLRKKLSSYTTR